MRCPRPFSKWLSAFSMALATSGLPSAMACDDAKVTAVVTPAGGVDWPGIRQHMAMTEGFAEFGFWGTDRSAYTNWTSHSNRLIPVYTFGTMGGTDGVDLNSYMGAKSPYRSEQAVQRMYGYVPNKTVRDDADWMDQTNLFDLQLAASNAGKKYIFLVIFDGMDWQTTQAAAVWNRKAVTYTEGRGDGTFFQTFDAGGTSQFGYMVTSPHNEGTDVDVDAQTVKNPGGKMRGGYDPDVAGRFPWSTAPDPGYLISKGLETSAKHAYTDSSSSASSMTAGIKTFNGAVNVDATGAPVATIAHLVQEKGWRIGAVSSVPVSHATPAASYAHNVSRDDYQDLTRDMLGLPSIQHPTQPLAGLDVVIGGGYGHKAKPADGVKAQGQNFVEGNVYLTEADLAKVDVKNGGKYVTAVRTSGQPGRETLLAAAKTAAESNQRILGFYGNGAYNGHLPFQTADGHYDPAVGKSGKMETYSKADLSENPILSDMTEAALVVLGRDGQPFWLMVESGDVDWANHDNNVDNSIGAVNSGDAAIRVITSWVEKNSNWNESLLIVTADHGHMLNLTQPALLVGPRK